MKEDDAHAFPSSNGMEVTCYGMTLRDYFAAHCPGDICDTSDRETAGEFIGRAFPAGGAIEQRALWNVEVEAKMRYLYADAMLAERAK